MSDTGTTRCENSVNDSVHPIEGISSLAENFQLNLLEREFALKLGMTRVSFSHLC